MPTIVQDNSLFVIDRELDFLLDEIQEQAESEDTEEVSSELMQSLSPVFATPETYRRRTAARCPKG
jgi:hypothetical protein